MLFLILSVSRNPLVLKERHSTLTAAGYSVTSTSSKEDAMAKLVDGDFDLVLICPSLGKDCCRLAHAVRRHRPSIPVVSTAPNDDLITPDSGVYVTGSSLGEIVAAMHEILANEQKKFAVERSHAPQRETKYATKPSA